MNGLLVRADRGNLSVTFDLSAFITDWEAARKTFVAFVAARFRELLNPRPGDFSAASPSELGEVWCKIIASNPRRSVERRQDIRRIEHHRIGYPADRAPSFSRQTRWRSLLRIS